MFFHGGGVPLTTQPPPLLSVACVPGGASHRVNSRDPHSKASREVRLWFSFYRWGIRGTERSSRLPKVTQPISDRSKIPALRLSCGRASYLPIACCVPASLSSNIAGTLGTLRLREVNVSGQTASKWQIHHGLHTALCLSVKFLPVVMRAPEWGEVLRVDCPSPALCQ